MAVHQHPCKALEHVRCYSFRVLPILYNTSVQSHASCNGCPSLRSLSCTPDLRERADVQDFPRMHGRMSCWDKVNTAIVAPSPSRTQLQRSLHLYSNGQQLQHPHGLSRRLPGRGQDTVSNSCIMLFSYVTLVFLQAGYAVTKVGFPRLFRESRPCGCVVQCHLVFYYSLNDILDAMRRWDDFLHWCAVSKGQ